MTLPRLFDDVGTSGATRAPASGLLVTNHLNLMYMLSVGLIMPPDGFGAKYYQDTLDAFPGWIPLFIDKAFGAAVQASVQEAGHLKPCLAQVRLERLAGPVAALRGNDILPLRFPYDADGTETVLFVPAPLPTHWIERILFQSAADRAACDADARDYSNVPWTDFKRVTVKSKFAKPSNAAWPPPSDLAPRAAPLAMPLAAGGVIAMLLHVANQGDLGTHLCRLAFDPDAEDRVPVEDPLLAALAEWLQSGHAQAASQLSQLSRGKTDARALQKQLYWGVVERLTTQKASEDAASLVLDYLEESARQLPESALKQKFQDLWRTLESLTGLSDMGTTEIFERHPTAFSRAMALFFLRPTCAQLLDFRHPLLTEADWLAAAILCGARGGWQELPTDLRDIPGLAPAVSHRMAAMSQRLAETNLEVGVAPARCRPLRELFQAAAGTRAAHREARLLLARKYDWDCIQTTIQLNEGQYALRGSGRGVQITFQGEPKNFVCEVEEERFFQHLANERIARKWEEEVRKMIGN